MLNQDVKCCSCAVTNISAFCYPTSSRHVSFTRHLKKNMQTIQTPNMRPSVLGGRKGIQPVKNSVVGYWRGHLSGARCRLAYSPADATATHCLLPTKKSVYAGKYAICALHWNMRQMRQSHKTDTPLRLVPFKKQCFNPNTNAIHSSYARSLKTLLIIVIMKKYA